jgi:MFS family permease
MSAALDAISFRFRALKHRNFRLFWNGQMISLVGTWMQSVAQLWLMHRLTGSAFMLGLLSFLQFLPVLAFSLWAGVIADRADKRRFLIATQIAAMVQAAILAGLTSFGMIQAWSLLSLALLFGVINSFDLPARQAFVFELVGKEDLPNAIALNSAAFNTARVFGPAVAGVIVGLGGEAWCFWVNAVTFIAVIWSLNRVRTAPHVAPAGGGGVFERMHEGLAYIRGVPSIRNLLVLLGVAGGLGFQYLVLLPVYAKDILHAGPEAYGLLVTSFGVGSLVAAGWMTRHQDRWGLRRNLLIGLASAAVGLGVFAWSRALPLSLAMGLVAGFGLILYVASTNTLLQLTTEDHFRARVMSFYTLMLVGTAPLGAILSGSIAQWIGAPAATTLSAIVLTGSATWVFFRLRALAAREAAQPTEPVWGEH